MSKAPPCSKVNQPSTLRSLIRPSSIRPNLIRPIVKSFFKYFVVPLGSCQRIGGFGNPRNEQPGGCVDRPLWKAGSVLLRTRSRRHQDWSRGHSCSNQKSTELFAESSVSGLQVSCHRTLSRRWHLCPDQP